MAQAQSARSLPDDSQKVTKTRVLDLSSRITYCLGKMARRANLSVSDRLNDSRALASVCEARKRKHATQRGKNESMSKCQVQC
jgi:hypothetical protein